MLDITSDDIARLDDEKLRSLVGLLCEAEVRRHGLSVSAVTWGGNQNAADGGLDVRVALPTDAEISRFIPRHATGFQVKKPDMPRNAILTEMCPSGTIRPVIADLANHSGAYIIVSSGSSTSDIMLKNRLAAMVKAVKGLANRDSLLLDFYDRTRIATWVRDHPGLIVWVREAVGQAIKGWHSYGAWAYSPGGVNDEYLLDNQLRLHTGKLEATGDGISAIEGIQRIRGLLSQPKSIVRLIGLSGVGKTRLLQALFDDRVGEQSLDPALAFYANLADEPDPQPTALASTLIATHTRAVLIVDNCSSDLHLRLGELCRDIRSNVSVITVEYDIRDDDPEGTEVFELKPSSIDLIKKLVGRRFPGVSEVDRETIAEFSGGNARIAFALASGIGLYGTIAGLNDYELFKRLFQQSHGDNEPLFLAAQACSLVYSFNGEDVSGGDAAELINLGAMVGKTASEIYRNIAELYRRDLVQKRGVWRAILPHAIANRLAVLALQNIPFDVIKLHVIEGNSSRLLKSFSRRLGFLHASQEAVTIVKAWLAVDGLLGDVANLDQLGRSMFDDVAPVDPEAALSTLERAMACADVAMIWQIFKHYINTIRKIAYDALYFERCVTLLVKLAEADRGNDLSDEPQDVIVSLFHIVLSGTHATIEQRLSVARSLIQSESPDRRGIGSKAISALLKGWPFTTHYNFDFGARSRNYGYWPRSSADRKHWYGTVLRSVEMLAGAGEPVGSEVRAKLAEQFRGLWALGDICDELEHACHAIAGQQFWREGWIAVRTTMYFDSNRFDPSISARLSVLAELLRPKNLAQKVRAIVLTPGHVQVSPDNYMLDSAFPSIDIHLRAELAAQSLGAEVALDEWTFGELLPELVASNSGRLWSFGRGLLEGAEWPKEIWCRLVKQLAVTPENQRSIWVLSGYLNGVYEGDRNLANAFLDEAVHDLTLAQFFPQLQVSIGLDRAGIVRLYDSLGLENCPIWAYKALGDGRISECLSGPDIRRLLLKIAAIPSGFEVAVYILQMRLYLDQDSKREHAPEIIDVGQEFLKQLTFTWRDVQDDYRLGEIAKACLVGSNGARIADELLRNLDEATSICNAHAHDYHLLVEAIVSVQPVVVLNRFLGGSKAEGERVVQFFHRIRLNGNDPLSSISQRILLEWCDQQGTSRYPTVAAVITAFEPVTVSEPPKWSNLALHILNRAPDRIKVLKQYSRQLRPTEWSDSPAAILETNSKLLEDLMNYPDRVVVGFIAEEKVRLVKELQAARILETQCDTARDQRFE